MTGHYLSRLVAPSSVVLVGASADPAKVGGRLLENLLAGGFRGKLFAVNPKHTEVRGVHCFSSVADLPETPDLAVIAHPRLPAATVEKVRQALLGMKTDPAASSVLTRAESRGFDPATDRDYDSVRQVYRLIGQ